MAAALPWASAGIGGLFNAIGGSKPKSSTSTFNQSGEQSANLDGKQSKVNKALFQQILAVLKLGPQVSQSDRNTARGQINDTYDGATTNMEANLAARGYGESGKVGKGFRDLSVERANDFQSTEAVLRDQSQNRFQQMIQNALAFMTPRSFSSSSSGTQTGTQSGTPWQSSLGGGLGDVSSLLWLKQMGGLGGGYAPGAGMNPNMSVPYPCAIAVELFGESDWRTMVARAWLLEQARRSRAWAVVVGVYALTGRHVARLIRLNKTARRVAQSLFDNLITKAINA